MAVPVKVSELSYRLPELLAEIRKHHETFLLIQEGETVGQLAPPPEPRRATLENLVALVDKHRGVDPSFADDLERIQVEQPLLENDPWDS